MVGVDARKMSDADFEQITAKYRLVRIHPVERLSGPGGPDDLAWVWIPVALMVAMALWRTRRKR
jgi:hypothetical protein